MSENNNKILNLEINEIIKKINEDKITVCVIGIGRIGLPTALSFAKSGLMTVGVDINSELIDKINSGIYPLKDEPEYDVIFENVTKNKKFQATNDIERAVPASDVILLSLPTPMDETNVPDYSALRIVGKQLNKLLADGTLVIVESTIEPGFIENELIKIIEGDDNRLKVGVNFSIGVCPETANPGEIAIDFSKLPRLVGAINEKTQRIIIELYKHVFPVDLIPMPNCKTANAVKLTTNVFRDINIAFINELALLFEKLGIDTMTVLEAAKTKYNFQVHYPGAGVGGPCLPVNSYQLLNSSTAAGLNELSIVKAGRKINEKMPFHVVDLITQAFSDANIGLKESSILILGVSYKPNVKDLQLSPAKIVIDELKKKGAKIKIYDPYFSNSTVYDIMVENNFAEILSDIDCLVLLTAHNEFLNIDPGFLKSRMKNPLLIDSRGVFEPKEVEKVGLIFKGVGRG
ncbi:MAG: nucleotide sugar dehydrogenase [Crenarchaeota archaeon]|nr:MAG: nucleotide sugar dehydrogenase [Thermoproteota archaeon]RDJ33467.1 MAG: nucleotide sugar dehydrogenase [Thermoproteota archaeon]RDJ36546.1 MAG: nucleotide sugar dehydrogenase [Thermoproteota archaeon]RDJ39272.1 MAG: nucleotide sugar dehydrogenase [Thermoproteota archaeon]